MSSRVQFKTGQGGGSAAALSVAFDSSVTANSLLICCVSCYQGGGTPNLTFSDNNSNSWTELYDNNYTSTDIGGLGYVTNANSGATTVTVDADGSSDFFTVVIIEVSGIETTTPLDQSNQATATSTTWDSGNITTTQANEYIIGVLAHDNGSPTLTEDGAFTLIFEEENGASFMPISVGERIVTSTLTESYSGSISSSSAYWSGIASFKDTAVAGGRIMGSIAADGGLAGAGGLAGQGGGLAG